jgi:hypothetical protein
VNIRHTLVIAVLAAACTVQIKFTCVMCTVMHVRVLSADRVVCTAYSLC